MTSNEWYNQQDYYQLCYHENNSSSDNSSFFDESPLHCKILAADRRQNLYDTLPGGHSQVVSVFGKPGTNKSLESCKIEILNRSLSETRNLKKI